MSFVFYRGSLPLEIPDKTANLEYALKNKAKFQPSGEYFNFKAANTCKWIRMKIKNGENKKQDWVAVPGITLFGEKYILHQICSGKQEVSSSGRGIP